MRRLLALLLFLAQALGPLPAAAGEFSPRVLFPAGQAWPVEMDGAITVEGALLQIELAPGQVLSAQQGARLALSKAGGGDDIGLAVLQGSVLWIDLAGNAVSPLPPGRYALSSAGLRPATDAGRSGVPREEADTLAPGYRLADAIMTQQQKYLDTLKVDVRDINHFLASIIRGLVPRRP